MSANIPVEASFWAEALIKLKSEHPKSYQHLEEIRSMQPQPSTSPEGLADELLAVIDAKISALNNPELTLPSNIRNDDAKYRIQRALDKIWKAVKACKSVGDLVTNIDPLHSGVAWIGVSIILQMALNGVEQNTAALEGLAQISPLVARYAKIEELYIKRRKDTKLDEAFKNSLIDLYVAILRYQVSLAHHLQRRKFVQYARSLPKLDDWGALLKDITSKDAECRTFTEIFKFEDQGLRLNLLNTRMDALFLQTSEIDEHHRKRANLHEQKDILNWISTVVPRQEHRRMLENSKLDREYANAGQWLFHHPKFQSWYAHRNDTAAIWLRGPVGTGKSSLVCLVIEHCLRDIQSSDADKEQIAYFYCTKKQGEGGSDPKTILRSLVRQLAWSGDSQSILKPIKDMYDESQLSYESGESRLSVTACISLLTKLMSGRQNTAIIIDALDECSNPRELLSNLRGIFTSAKSGIRFLFSSRMMNFDVLKEVPECAIVEVSSESHTDIEFYVNTEVDSRRGLLPERTWTRELEDRLVEILTRQAQGMFRWVQLQLEVFFSPKSPLRHSKDIISKLDRLDVDVSTPELNTVYDEIYEMNAQHPQDRTYASKALEWVMCSPRPLTTAALVDAISIDLNGTIDTEVDETYLMQICSNFLVTDARGRIQFAHLSVREYLTSREANFKIKAHAEVAKSCLAYVLHTQYADISGMRRDDIGEGFGEYAVWYWPVHCSESGELRQQDDSLRKMFESFMSIEEVHDAFVRWMHFLCSVQYDYDRWGYGTYIKLDNSICSPPNPWFTACAWGFPEVLRTSLQTASNLERRNVRGYTGLFLATRHGHLDVVQQLIENGVNIETTNKGGYTALHTSIRYWQRDIMRILLDNGASCMKSQEESDFSGYLSDISEYPGFNALHLVATLCDKEMMELILQKGVDIDTRTPKGETALHIAAKCGHIKQVPLLMKYGACIESRTLKGETALHIAVQFGNKKMMELILQKGVDIDTRTAEGETALYIAAKCGHTEQVRLLMKYGACIESKTNRGRTAISEAAIGGHEEIVRILMDEHNSSEDVKQLLDVAMVVKSIDFGWEVRELLREDDGNDGQNNRVSSILRTVFGPKMLHLAVSHGNEKIVALLLNRGVGVHVRDDLGRSPLLRAIDEYELGVAELLLDHGANIEASEGIKRRAICYEAQNGATHRPGVLHYAARQGRLRIVKLLLENGADIDAKDGRGNGVLHYAAEMGSLRTMKFLLENGADIEAEDGYGNRALHLASDGLFLTSKHDTALKLGVEVEDAPGSSELVQLLLEKGAIIEAENKQGSTALDRAVYNVNVVAVKLLLEKGAIPRRVYDDALVFEYERRIEGFEERWSAIQDMIDAWSESASDYR